ncbi:MAG: sialate O-acetylesterase [Verrucomicrobiota bacterium]
MKINEFDFSQGRGKWRQMLLAGVIILVLSVSVTNANIKVLIFAGQSNAEGVGSNHNDLPVDLRSQQDDLFFVDRYNTNWRKMDSPNTRQRIDQGYGPYGFGGEVTLARTIADSLGGDVYVIKMAWSSTSLERDWLNPDPGYSGHRFGVTPGDSLYTRMRSKVYDALAKLENNTGQETEIAAFFWMQGEGDASSNFKNGQWVANFHTMYEDNLVELAAKVRADFGDANLPFILGRIGDDFSTSNKWTNVRNAQVSFAQSDVNAYWINTDSFPMATDSLHYNSQGHQELGVAFAQKYLEVSSAIVPTATINWISDAPIVLPLTGNTKVWVSYDANTGLDLIVDVLSNDGNYSWFGGTRVEIGAADNKVQEVPINIFGALTSGNSYLISAKVVPRGGNFTQAIAIQSRVRLTQ